VNTTRLRPKASNFWARLPGTTRASGSTVDLRAAASGVLPLRHFAPLPRLRFACVSPRTRTLQYSTSTCYRTMTHDNDE
jgi:hypothetical protein